MPKQDSSNFFKAIRSGTKTQSFMNFMSGRFATATATEWETFRGLTREARLSGGSRSHRDLAAAVFSLALEG